jgi:prophage antirepressor-like protein
MTTPHTNGSRKNGHDHSHAQPYHSPGNGTQHKEKQSLDTALAHQFDFDGAKVRVISIDGAPWFVAADVCRALNIAPSNGGYSSALRKLDADEKCQISQAWYGAAPQSVSDGGPQSLNGGMANDETGANAWLVSESGLYLLILRSRAATTPGTVPHRFRRWVTREVLPTIRATGGYGHTSITGDTVTLSLAEHARYVVLVSPGELPQIRKTPKDKLLDEWSGLDTEILANHMRIVEALWQKTQIVRSLGDDPAGGLLYKRLGKAISDGRRIADECLDSFRQQPD